VLPAALKAHPRNKSDDELKFIANHGGFIGVTMFSPFLAKGNDASIEDYVAAIDYVVGIAGVEGVGIGTDFTQDQDGAFFDWLTHDKGYARRLVNFAEVVNPEGMRKIGDFPNLTQAMEKADWPERKIRRVMGENWVRVLGEVWDA
jgi:membrane dipeptidase